MSRDTVVFNRDTLIGLTREAEQSVSEMDGLDEPHRPHILAEIERRVQVNIDEQAPGEYWEELKVSSDDKELVEVVNNPPCGERPPNRRERVVKEVALHAYRLLHPEDKGPTQ